MGNGRSWRDDPSVKFAMKRAGVSPWDILLVNCRNAKCGAQNYFEDGVSESCRLCGESIADLAGEAYSVGMAIELEMEEKRLEALGELDDDPLDLDKSQTMPLPEPPPPPEPLTPSQRVLTMLWILICIAFVAALAWLSDGHCWRV